MKNLLHTLFILVLFFPSNAFSDDSKKLMDDTGIDNVYLFCQPPSSFFYNINTKRVQYDRIYNNLIENNYLDSCGDFYKMDKHKGNFFEYVRDSLFNIGINNILNNNKNYFELDGDIYVIDYERVDGDSIPYRGYESSDYYMPHDVSYSETGSIISKYAERKLKLYLLGFDSLESTNNKTIMVDYKETKKIDYRCWSVTKFQSVMGANCMYNEAYNDHIVKTGYQTINNKIVCPHNTIDPYFNVGDIVIFPIFYVKYERHNVDCDQHNYKKYENNSKYNIKLFVAYKNNEDLIDFKLLDNPKGDVKYFNLKDVELLKETDNEYIINLISYWDKEIRMSFNKKTKTIWFYKK